MTFKEIPVEETTEDKFYFIAKTAGAKGYLFYSRYKSGKELFSTKPGIAIHYHGGPGLVKAFAKNASVPLVAIEIPDNHAKLWRAKK